MQRRNFAKLILAGAVSGTLTSLGAPAVAAPRPDFDITFDFDPKMDEWYGHGEHQYSHAWCNLFQGMTPGSQYWYVTSNQSGTGRGVWRLDHDFTKAKWMKELSLPAAKHIGAPSYDAARNRLFVALEPGGKGQVWEIQLSGTGGWTGATTRIRYLDDGGAQPQNYSAPWCAVNPMDGLLYSSVFGSPQETPNRVDRIFAYDPDDNFRLARTITIPYGFYIHRIQGGAFGRIGNLYLSSDRDDKPGHKKIHGYRVPHGTGNATAIPLGTVDINAPNLEVEGVAVGAPTDFLPAGGPQGLGDWIRVGCLRVDWASLDNVYMKRYHVPDRRLV
ncbi:hypothetical protein ACIOMM_34820 [Streptomyces sp. NPDC087908]|uniref:hypothetical protein n=1 Tax=Streptomyces sp. NPDC087908 TaxID=3365820 RepID=UPI00382BB267